MGSIFPLVFIVFFLVAPACRRAGDTGTTLTIAGSTSVQPFAEKLAETYMATHPGLAINVQGGGSTAGVRAAETGAAQIGMSSRHLKDNEESLHQVTIALDGIAIIVNAANPVAGLTRAEVAAIFAGEIPRWSTVGGRDRPIHFVTREEGSGTRGAFEEMVMGKKEIAPRALVQDSNGAVREIVASDPDALGYISLGLVDRRVRAVAVDGVLADPRHDRRQALRGGPPLPLPEPRGTGRGRARLHRLRARARRPAPARPRRPDPGGAAVNTKRRGEKGIELTLTLIAVSSIAILFIITFFIFKEGLPFIIEVGPGKLLGALDWAPTKGKFGLLPMIVGSLARHRGGAAARRPARALLRDLPRGVLQAARAPDPQAGDRAARRHPVGRLRLPRRGLSRAADPRTISAAPGSRCSPAR